MYHLNLKALYIFYILEKPDNINTDNNMACTLKYVYKTHFIVDEIWYKFNAGKCPLCFVQLKVVEGVLFVFQHTFKWILFEILFLE